MVLTENRAKETVTVPDQTTALNYLAKVTSSKAKTLSVWDDISLSLKPFAVATYGHGREFN